MTPELKSYQSYSFNTEDSPSHSTSSYTESHDATASDANGKRPSLYHCTDCEKAFKFKSELDRHLTVHTKNRPYSCSFPGCKKSFKRSDALASHFRNHVKQRVFECTVEGCGSTFTTKSALKYHNMRHQSEKNFKCTAEGCGKAFITSAQLKQHEKNNHNKDKDNKDSKSQLSTEGKTVESEVYENNTNLNNFEYFEDSSIPENEFGDFLNCQPTIDFQGLNGVPEIENNMIKLENNINMARNNINTINPNNNFSNINMMLLHLYKDATGGQDCVTPTETSDEYVVDNREAKVEKKFTNILTNILMENDQLKKKIKVTEDNLDMRYQRKPTADVDQFFDMPTPNQFAFIPPQDNNMTNYGYYM